MAQSRDYDPRALIDAPEALMRLSDVADASALKLQATLHRQRVGAARARLRRAVAGGADPADLEALRAEATQREGRLAEAEERFAVANVAKPAPKEGLAQLFGVAIGEVAARPLTAALLGPEGKAVARAQVNENGAFHMTLEGSAKVSLQISDTRRRVLFRDPEPTELRAGEVVHRRVQLTGPKPKPAAPPETLIMPDLVGQDEDGACAILWRLGVREIKLVDRPGRDREGLVVAHSPEAGAELVPSRGAVLEISRKVDEPQDDERVPVPELVGLLLDEAERKAKDARFALEPTRVENDARPNEVVSQKPQPGERAVPPGPIRVEVARPRAPGPFLNRLAKAAAADERLAIAGLKPKETRERFDALGLGDAEAVEALIALDNEALRDKADLENLAQARSFRALLRRALEASG